MKCKLFLICFWESMYTLPAFYSLLFACFSSISQTHPVWEGFSAFSFLLTGGVCFQEQGRDWVRNAAARPSKSVDPVRDGASANGTAGRAQLRKSSTHCFPRLSHGSEACKTIILVYVHHVLNVIYYVTAPPGAISVSIVNFALSKLQKYFMVWMGKYIKVPHSFRCFMVFTFLWWVYRNDNRKYIDHLLKLFQRSGEIVTWRWTNIFCEYLKVFTVFTNSGIKP